MGLFDFFKPKKKNLLRVTIKGGITVNGKSASATVYDEIIDPADVNLGYKERDILDGYEIKHFSFRSLDDAKGKKKQYEDKIKRERTNGFAIKGGSNLYKMTPEDRTSIKEFDTLIKPILKNIKNMPLQESINDISNLYRSFNENTKNEISRGYVRWYFEYATILFDIENQFNKR
ncbi:hypothetical protein ACS126_01585 [Sphingobacterium lactis]|uniref:hypothetical protein n=1 Tax=Sphingobacterium lactis TaxID=797291 RepID=UPI003EC61915